MFAFTLIISWSSSCWRMCTWSKRFLQISWPKQNKTNWLKLTGLSSLLIGGQIPDLAVLVPMSRILITKCMKASSVNRWWMLVRYGDLCSVCWTVFWLYIICLTLITLSAWWAQKTQLEPESMWKSFKQLTEEDVSFFFHKSWATYHEACQKAKEHDLQCYSCLEFFCYCTFMDFIVCLL